MKKQLALLSGLLTTTLFSNTVIEQKQFDLVQSILPGTKIEKVQPSPVSGIYEAYFKDGSLMYVLPHQRLIFMGELYTNTGTSITQKSIEEYKANNKVETHLEQSVNALMPKTKENQEYLKSLVENGIKVGTKQKHKHTIVVLKSLSCPNCLDLDKYLETKKGVVTYVYLAPDNQSKEFYQTKYNISNPQAKLKEQTELVMQRIRGFGVPFALIIDEQYNLVDTIHGFDKQKWDQYIGDEK